MTRLTSFRYICAWLLLVLWSDLCLGSPTPRKTPLDTHPDNNQPDLEADRALAPNITNLDSGDPTPNTTAPGDRNTNSNNIHPTGTNLNSSTTHDGIVDYNPSDDDEFDDDDDDNDDDDGDWNEDPSDDANTNDNVADCNPDTPTQPTWPDDGNQKSDSSSDQEQNGGKRLVAPNSTNPGQGSNIGKNISSSTQEHNTAHGLLISLRGMWHLTFFAIIWGNLLIIL
ncbi:hypothetical protein PTTG_03598 [Puccinia triticina 1-1 BBBD Race 1]|uniref:Uncharacterized protein n=1 Tax=Puccinia triticina (isolate 1-1 / race 1 (BBBD)) TaxID=630390 RepID=A0A180GH40_PUCT1|nr:hypothetical protein PTTG_03598 [Puccinia triticina 1-1 BBBD Race 1]